MPSKKFFLPGESGLPKSAFDHVVLRQLHDDLRVLPQDCGFKTTISSVIMRLGQCTRSVKAPA